MKKEELIKKVNELNTLFETNLKSNQRIWYLLDDITKNYENELLEVPQDVLVDFLKVFITMM